MKKLVKSLTALVLAAALLCGLFPHMQAVETASAEDATVYIWNYPLSGDSKASATWGHGDLTYMNGYHQGANSKTRLRCTGSWNGNIAYCIEPGANQGNYDTYGGYGEDFWENMENYVVNDALGANFIRNFIGRILLYGYNGTIKSWKSQNANADDLAWAMATQYLIWEVIVGERDVYFNHRSAAGCNVILDQLSTNHPLYDRVMAHYNSMVASVQSHTTRPSFCSVWQDSAQTVTLNWDGSAYVGSISDSNGVLSNYTAQSSNADISVWIDGNTLYFRTTSYFSSNVNITLSRKNTTRISTVIWSDGVFNSGTSSNRQDMVTYGAQISDPVSGYLKLSAPPLGDLTIHKTDSETGQALAGVTYTLYDSAGNTLASAVTGANGDVTFSSLQAGTYLYRETATVKGYHLDGTTYSASVQGGNTTSQSRSNTPRKGSITLQKNSASGAALSGVTFLLESSSNGGATWYEIARAQTNQNGYASFSNLKATDTLYRVTELSTVSGQSLLSTSVYQGPLPLAYQVSEISDPSTFEVIGATAYKYDLHFTVTDQSQLTMPFTGGEGFTFAIAAASLSLLLGAGILILNYKKKENTQ